MMFGVGIARSRGRAFNDVMRRALLSWVSDDVRNEPPAIVVVVEVCFRRRERENP